jgi:hypothetical protein
MIKRVPILEQKVEKREKHNKKNAYKEGIGQQISFRQERFIFMFKVAFCVKEIKSTGYREDKKP